MKVRCSKCKAVHNISDDKLKGKSGKVRVRCPKCRAVLVLPASGSRGTDAGTDKPAGEPVKVEKPEWYYAREGAQQGPVTASELAGMLASGALAPSTLVWRPGLDTWTTSDTVAELSAAGASAAAGDEPAGAAPREEAGAEPSQPEDAAGPGVEPAGDLGPTGEPAGGIDPEAVASDEAHSTGLSAERAAAEPEEGGTAAAHRAPEEPDYGAPATEPVAEEPAYTARAPEQDSQDAAVAGVPADRPAYDEPEQPVERPVDEVSSAAAEESVREEPAGAGSQDAPAAFSAGGGLFDGLVSGQPTQGSYTSAQPAESDGGDDLFAGFDSPAEEKQQPAQPKGQEMLYSRRETSVLFSLDDLVQKKDGGGKKAKQKKADDSGLIDIRQIGGVRAEDDLFAGLAGPAPGAAPGPQQQSVVADLRLAVPTIRRRKKLPMVLAGGLGGLAAAGAVAYGLYFVLVLSGGSVELVGQVLASASERAYKQRMSLTDKLEAEGRSKIDAARQEAAAARAETTEKAGQALAALKTAKQAELAEFKTSQEKSLIELQGSVAKARENVEKRKAALAAATAPAAAGPTEAAGAASAIPAGTSGTDKASSKDGEKKKEAAAKDKEKGKDKDKEKGKDKEKVDIGSVLADGAKKPEKEVEKPAEKEPVAEAPKEKDPQALLKMLDEKKEDGGDAGGAAGGAEKKTLTTTDIMKVVNGNKGAMRDCFTKYGQGLESATIRTKLTISGNGTVSDVTISSMEFAGTALGNCVRSVQMKMKFPTFSSGSLSKAISVRLP